MKDMLKDSSESIRQFIIQKKNEIKGRRHRINKHKWIKFDVFFIGQPEFWSHDLQIFALLYWGSGDDKTTF